MRETTLTPDLIHSGAVTLRAHLGIDVVTPFDERWDEARLAWNLAVDQQPAAVGYAESADDVAALVGFAREHGLRVAAQGTGHGSSALQHDDTLLLKTERMTGVEVFPETRRARVEAGALWMDVTAAAGEHGLAALSGSSPDVGVVGYTLGGGLSWLARSKGLAADHVTAIEVVTAEGRLVRVDHENEPGLFWALRGGGGSFAVVTALEFELFEVAQVYAGMLAFPIERSAEVLHAWREWVAAVPEETTSIGRILRVPPLPDIPEPVRGRHFAIVEAVHLGDEREGAELLRPLRELGPEIDTFAMVPPPALSHLHMDPEHPVPGAGDHMLLGELPPAAIDALVEANGHESGSPLLSVEIRHLGGALARARDGCGALGAIEAGYAVFGVGMVMDEAAEAAIRRQLAIVKDGLAPWDAGCEYMNFADVATDSRRLFTARTHDLLREVKVAYDPDNVFRANHEIPPAH